MLGDRIHGGIIAVPRGRWRALRRIEVIQAGHPLPDDAGRRAAHRVLTLAAKLTARDLLVVLLSGGASSLLPAPSPPVTLADKRRVTRLLLASGATIQEVNTVRKHLSLLKGGRLAAATSARIISLILSDVVGHDPSTIASGPTAPDPTTFADARAVLDRYRLWARIPGRARARLAAGLRGGAEETPKPSSPVFRRVQNEIIGSNAMAVAALAKTAADHGLHPIVLSTSLTGEAREAAKLFGAIARELHHTGRPVRRPACVLAGGELTVTLQGAGRGGRAQEFALAAAIEIAGLPDLWIAGFGTDGADGPTDVAGAVADGGMVARAARLRIDPMTALRRNDAYRFFQKVGGHIRTGLTGTNLNDLYLLLAL
jgi:glycerate-2-kinase